MFSSRLRPLRVQLFRVFSVFYLFVVLVMLSVPVQVIDWTAKLLVILC